MNPEDTAKPSAEQFARASGVSREAARDWPQYWRQCRARLRVIHDVLETYSAKHVSDSRILDWGCAAGGVAMLIDHELQPQETHAADVDPHSIAWLQQNWSNITATQLEFGQPLPYDTDYFDVIIGISVFTHINPAEQTDYLRELHRITGRGGILLLTVASYYACDFNKEHRPDTALHPTSREKLKVQGTIFSRYPDKTLKLMEFADEGADYGQCYHSRETIHSLFGKFFDVRAIQEGVLGAQDLVVLQKVQ